MRPLTIERALAEANRAGCIFRLSGSIVTVRGLDRLPIPVVDFLRQHRTEVFAHLGGDEHDRPAIELLERLGVGLVYATDDDAAAAAVAEVFANAGSGPVAVDFETAPKPGYVIPTPLRLTVRGKPMKIQPKANSKLGLCPYRAEPRLVQLYGGGARVAVLDMAHVGWHVLAPVWERPIVCHNGSFELAFLAKRDIHPKAQCSMQGAGLMLGVRRRGLADACSAYLGLDIPKTHQTSDWGAATLSRGQLAYAAADAVLCRRLWIKVACDLNANGRDRAYRLQRDVLPAAAAMELRGIALDLDAHAELCDRWAVDLADARQAWINQTGTPPPAKPADAAEYLRKVLPDGSLARWPKTSTGSLSTAADQLAKVAHLPAIRPLLRIKKSEKLLSAFGPKLRRLINPETGRLHPHYSVAGTKAGRWSASEPNIQQLPANADTRRIIVAAPGHVLVGVDFSQMELRAAAWISGDAELTHAYEQGLDVHVLTAAAINGIEPEAVTKEQRAAAKPINFGSIYGMSAKGLAASAWANYGIELSEADAKLALDRFFAKYAGLRKWMRTHADECKRKRRVMIGAGRVVQNAWEGKYGLTYPQCCNLPVQGACADAMMRAIVLVHQELPSILVAMVHDELLAEVPEADAAATVETLKSCLHDAFVETFPGAPTLGLVDAHVGRSWADVH
jgi:DNA polymerase I